MAELATLTRDTRDPGRAWQAAFALARAPGDDARHALEVVPKSAAEGRLYARASVVRALTVGESPRDLADRLRALLASRDPADRATGAFGLGALGKVDVRDLLGSRDLVVVRAAARAALLGGREAAEVAARRLAVETDRATRAALALALAVSTESFAWLSTAQLAAWAESDEALAPLAVLALGTREVAAQERQLGRFLESPDPVLRAHAALALALSPLASAASRLDEAWRFEERGPVRRAIVVALARRTEPERLDVLTLASRLDPDADVREAARLALAGDRGELPFPVGQLGAGCAGRSLSLGTCQVAWIALSPTSAAPSGQLQGDIAGRSGSYHDPTGLALPVVSDPDGALLLPGVSRGPASFRLASSSSWDEAPHDDREGDPHRGSAGQR